METRKGNKLIAEFLGWKPIRNYPNVDNNLSVHYERGEDWLQPTSMRYHTSWDWLMPVVDKINTLPVIQGMAMQQYGQIDNVIDALSKVDKLKIWQAVVNFIQWYNTTLNK